MKVILLGELKGKGGEGDIVDVAQGFAENYLYPNRIALPATAGNIKQLAERRHNIAKREDQRLGDAEALRAAIDGKTVRIDAKVGDEGQLFGSVTSTVVADAVKEQLGVEIERKRIEINRAIKTSGLHDVKVSLYRDIAADLRLQVGKPDEQDTEPAEAPADPTEKLSAESDVVVVEDEATASIETSE